MSRTILTAAAAALLATTAFLASFDDAEARGRAGGFANMHRMSKQVRHAGISRAANMRAKQFGRVHARPQVNKGLRGNHAGRVHARPQIKKGLHAGLSGRVHAKPQINKGWQAGLGGRVNATPQINKGLQAGLGGRVQGMPQINKGLGLNRNQFGQRPGLNGLNKQAAGAPPTRLGNLQPGLRPAQNQPQGGIYRQMGNNMPNTTPQANNTPPQNPPPAPQNQNPQNKPQYNPAKELLTNWGKEFINQIPQVALPSATPGTVYSAGGAIKTLVSPPPVEYIEASKNCLQTGVCVRPNPAGLAVTSFIDPRSSTLVNVGVDVLTPDPRLGGKAKLDVGGAAAVQGVGTMVDPIGTVQRQLGGNLPAAWGDLGK